MAVILVVGSRNCGKRSLIEGILSLLDVRGAQGEISDTPAGAEAGKGTSGSEDLRNSTPPSRLESIEEADALFEVYPVAITTKYYSVQVELWRQAKPLSVPALRSCELKGLEGIIVVFDVNEEASWEEGEGWAGFCEAHEACTLRVCVASKVDLLPQLAAGGEGSDGRRGLEERRRRCQEWCLDNGFELVEADCRDTIQGGESREKDGVPRVVEALQSNMWADMEFLTFSRPSGSLAIRGEGSVASSRSTRATDGGTINDPEAVGYQSVDGAEAVSEHLEGFVGVGDEDEGGEDAEALGYGALESDDDDDGDDGAYQDHDDGGSSGPVGTREDAKAVSQEGARGRDGGDPDVEGVTTSVAPGASGCSGREHDARPVSGAAEGPASNGALGADRDNWRIEARHLELQARWEGSAGSAPCLTHLTCGAGGKEGMEESRRVERGDAVKVDKEVASGAGRDEGTAGSDPRAGARKDEGDGASGRETGDGNGSLAPPEAKMLEAAGTFIRGLGIDDDSDEVEWLMSEVRRARGDGGKVSDEERRTRAANVASRLAALLGEDDDDEDDDED